MHLCYHTWNSSSCFEKNLWVKAVLYMNPSFLKTQEDEYKNRYLTVLALKICWLAGYDYGSYTVYALPAWPSLGLTILRTAGYFSDRMFLFEVGPTALQNISALPRKVQEGSTALQNITPLSIHPVCGSEPFRLGSLRKGVNSCMKRSSKHRRVTHIHNKIKFSTTDYISWPKTGSVRAGPVRFDVISAIYTQRER